MTDTLLGLDEPPQPRAEAYRVLARKYRPQTFSELIGQDAMVQTLGNAIKRDRLAHAFLMTGVRGVGKTSTARLIAKALNCIGADGQGGPTIDPCGVCDPCRSIAEGRHMDVIEMDAASHTGVDDVREIIDASRYAAVSARFKIYIVDEVHMLSKNAFNALLKTLEEPPPHVKFLFATTEVNKVPITVLSRCQRFDLRRISADKLAEHFGKVCDLEGVVAEPEALALIARASEGSARDGLSILDQAIAHAGLEGEAVTARAVREMLGLSDRGAVRDLFALVLTGDGAGALNQLRRQYDLGVDPLAVLRGLLETVHGVTLAKVNAAPDAAQSAEERQARADWAAALSFPALHRLWQLFLKGHEEVGRAALPIEAAEMALLRAIHASTLPDPGDLARQIAAGTVPAPTATATAPAPAAAKAAEPAASLPPSFEALVEALDRAGSLGLAVKLKQGTSVVRYDPPELVLSGARPMSADTLSDLNTALKALSGRAWRVSFADQPGEPTLLERERGREEAAKQAILDSPMIKAAFEAFPDAELETWPGQRSA
ncbi:MAG: polymerase subunit gamma/tau [Sphingomonas bacterium]|uniref:DNA polymerase III subunit gamma/tau n=1 Tax=Sphingomonas bacterium TaxID=1895847 RepID=UPI002601F5D1|nr:DNA polymerase III subunit gamma/tau [Sphingomonas bacterium]MDB5694757.1 polymerase subunit gamma/tau [Sphingomonas bacterium]